MTWWQDIAFIYDEIYVTLRTNDEVARLAMNHPRWKYVERIVMDRAGNQHQASESAFEEWKAATGLTPVCTSKTLLVGDGIARTRLSLFPHPITRIPGLMIGTQCPKTQWELAEGYRYRVDPKNNEIIDGKPIDRNNHSAKAIAYGLVYRLGLAKRTKTKINAHRRESGYELFDEAA